MTNPGTPDQGRDIATSRDEPRVGSGDFAEEAADIGEWRCADRRTSEDVTHTEALRERRATKPNLDREHAEPLIVGAEAKADATERASCCDFEVWPQGTAA